MKFSKESVNKLRESFSIGADVSAACYYANISRQTYYNWAEKNYLLKEEFYRLKQKPVLKAFQTVFNNLDKAENARWYLERKRKKEFSPRVETDDLGKGQEIDSLKKKLKDFLNEEEA